MSLAEKLLSGLILLTFVAVVLKNPQGTNDVLHGLAQFNRTTFGTFLGVA